MCIIVFQKGPVGYSLKSGWSIPRKKILLVCCFKIMREFSEAFILMCCETLRREFKSCGFYFFLSLIVEDVFPKPQTLTGVKFKRERCFIIRIQRHAMECKGGHRAGSQEGLEEDFSILSPCPCFCFSRCLCSGSSLSPWLTFWSDSPWKLLCFEYLHRKLLKSYYLVLP